MFYDRFDTRRAKVRARICLAESMGSAAAEVDGQLHSAYCLRAGVAVLGRRAMKSLVSGLLLTLALPGMAPGPGSAEPRLVLAQAQIQIPSDAQLDRMEQQGIATAPLYAGSGQGDGGIAAENRRMEQQAHEIDEKLLRGGICGGC